MELEEDFNDNMSYRFFSSYASLVSKYAYGFSFSKEYIDDMGSTLRYCLAKPAILVTFACILLLGLFHNWVDAWTRFLIFKVNIFYGVFLKYLGPWKCLLGNSKRVKGGSLSEKSLSINNDFIYLGDRVPFSVGVYSMQGRRPHQEDRHLIDVNLGESGIAMVAVFDGHGGQFAVDYITTNIVPTFTSILPSDCKDQSEVDKSFISKRETIEHDTETDTSNEENILIESNLINVSDNSIQFEPQQSPDTSKENDLDFLKLLSDGIKSLDKDLIKYAKQNSNLSGSTALISLIHRDQLIVANVGDSRGVMCDIKGNVIPVSFDHKPQQRRERTRIEQAGGFVTYNGVWRVAGILATSRALGDFTLKKNNYVVSDPDVLTFNLQEIKPKFVILATDGLWDVMRNEEAVEFVSQHLEESDHGAKKLCLRAYDKGSADNITALIITFLYA